MPRRRRVWEQYLEESEPHLTPRQYAVAVISMMETSMQLQNLHLPWLMLLRRPGGPEQPSSASR